MSAPDVTRELNKITILKMQHPAIVSRFLFILRGGMNAGFNDFIIDISNVDGAYPDVLVPIAGIMDFYKQLGVTFSSKAGVPRYLENINLFNPPTPDEWEVKNFPLDKIWKFKNSQEISTIVDSYIEAISQETVCADGVLLAVSWSLFEIMDNVLLHAESGFGYIMAQIHPTTQMIAFCIYDPGRGIFNSLKGSVHAPRTPLDAITLAIQEGVTRDKSVGQGNGMWGLHKIIKENAGLLAITSDSAQWKMQGDVVSNITTMPTISPKNGSTTIDFMFHIEKEISLPNALSGHEPIDLRIVKLENDATGEIDYLVKEKASGTGTRESGERLRNDVVNIYRSAKKKIKIDFTNIAVVSSSFADEFLGKLVVEFGFSNFTSIFSLGGMNETVGAIVNRSVAQRIAQSFLEKKE